MICTVHKSSPQSYHKTDFLVSSSLKIQWYFYVFCLVLLNVRLFLSELVCFANFPNLFWYSRKLWYHKMSSGEENTNHFHTICSWIGFIQSDCLPCLPFPALFTRHRWPTQLTVHGYSNVSTTLGESCENFGTLSCCYIFLQESFKNVATTLQENIHNIMATFINVNKCHDIHNAVATFLHVGKTRVDRIWTCLLKKKMTDFMFHSTKQMPLTIA